ncbi:MAG: histidine phosphatase family protein [Candidatus Aquiluna sp. XM-24bin5]|nr:MAG: histidine phosphatase family protein [Candidatus Aquiluna sp. XM-24bin5]
MFASTAQPVNYLGPFLASETVLGLFRHGQTDWNIDLRLQGTADIPMNDYGIEQVRNASLHLTSDWDVVLSSPLGRAKHSAEILAERIGAEEVLIDNLLLERAFGIGEGMLYSEWHEKYSKLDEIPGAESTQAVAERARKLLGEINSRYAGARVLAVSHGALIRFVLAEVTNGEIPPKGERLENASLHVLRDAGGWSLDAWAPKPLGAS